MKKLLKVNSILLASFLSTAPIIACNSSYKQNNSSSEESPYKHLIEENLVINPAINEFANKHFFKGDKKSLKEFFNEQIRVESKFKNELNISLTFAPLFIPNILNIASEFQLKHAINSVDVISQTLTQRWFWYIQNIKNFSYVFNNWRSDFKDYKNADSKDDESDKKVFEEVYKKEGKLLKVFKDYSIKEFSNEYKIETMKTDKFFNVKITFLRLVDSHNNSILIPIFLYQKTENGDTEILITGDIFNFENDNNDWKIIYEKLANYISEGRKYFAQKTIDYQKRLFDQSSNDEGQKFDETKFLKDYNDVKFLQNYNKNNYMNAFYYAINKFNKELQNENMIHRYTWGFVNEK
ncbi:hypothetical protein MCANUFG4_01971 [Mycoplasmopsis canis UFG4]|uniref:Lipoprotein n=2 Tax=Mycoplasmopsis canis TaxID=29555 RepID=I1A5P3_9BACT|nr:aromatic motif membrane protein [Mycoplasmopsis canis]AMD81117.1 hypothetical protein AXW82_00885 [Mycoplasmopsis canis PG 14]EIE39817.1 hypothetical protein MCANPG14_02046 [Mycoplasmopsis canis PG 14]EIE41814.1 hypothetical protein MCANUFG4_01971 [Mycoplasmopsis canis UFG4]VEU68938.1 Uncharacterised protein [Mycoplasmopsis canis]